MAAFMENFLISEEAERSLLRITFDRCASCRLGPLSTLLININRLTAPAHRSLCRGDVVYRSGNNEPALLYQ